MLNQISKWKGVLNDEECGAEVHIDSERVPDHSTTEEMDSKDSYFMTDPAEKICHAKLTGQSCE